MSHAALYRHFQGKRGLLAELALEGYSEFGERLARRTRGRCGEALLVATFRAYFEFSTENPGRFRALFHPLLRDKRGLPELEAAAEGSLDGLRRILRASGPPRARLDRAAAHTWSAIHGLATLWADGWLPGRAWLPQESGPALAKELAKVIARGLSAGAARRRDGAESAT